ncbi:ABC transporter ATP-binding protein [Candidatus Sumerlaeota bacterium]
MPADNPLLQVEKLRVYFDTPEGESRAVDDVSFRIMPGQTVGMVGESGCGKSVTSLAILGLINEPPGRIVGGRIMFRGADLRQLSEAELRRIRGDRISMIFQEPMSSLNPVMTVGAQVAEVFGLHRGMNRREAWGEAARMLELVRIPNAAARRRDYPHQLSGGMRQRVMIAMALAGEPDLLIADEPTTALDITIQAQILELMDQLKEQFRSSVLLITHDLGVIAETCDYVCVMYAGRIIERGLVGEIFANPSHPYTVGLLESIPRLEEIQAGRRLASIKHNVPPATRYPTGCRFHPRCSLATEECAAAVPPMQRIGDTQRSACIHVDQLAAARQTGPRA